MRIYLYKHVPYYHGRSLFHWALQPFREVRYFVQRGRRGFSDRDLWDLDSWATKTLGEAVLAYRDNIYSVPANMSEDEWRLFLTELGSDMIDYNNRWDDAEDHKTAVAAEALTRFADRLGWFWD